jgi:hypothetical protein
MRRAIQPLIITSLTLAGWMCSARILADSAPPATRPAATQKAPSDLLLLDDDPADADNGKPQADNSRCHVCHINFAREQLALTHARKGVGCATCHGPSDAHIADESWASGGKGTAPDIMFPPDKINPGCLHCHEAKLDRDKHKSFLAGQTDQRLCTDCHGKHKMAQRKCRWK